MSPYAGDQHYEDQPTRSELEAENQRLKDFAFGDAPEWEKANCSQKHRIRELEAEVEGLQEEVGTAYDHMHDHRERAEKAEAQRNNFMDDLTRKERLVESQRHELRSLKAEVEKLRRQMDNGMVAHADLSSEATERVTKLEAEVEKLRVDASVEKLSAERQMELRERAEADRDRLQAELDELRGTQ